MSRLHTIVALGMAALLGLRVELGRPLPPAMAADPHGTVVFDRHGAVLASLGEGAPPAEDWGRWLSLATVAAEDHRLGLHPGVDPVGIARAAVVNLRAGEVKEGGSTLAQQLARRVEPRAPGWLGKLGEARLALRLTAQLGGHGVLDQYLRRTWYGNGATGAGRAARLYFDRPPAALSLAQAAALAAIPRRPASLDPLDNPLLVQRARDRVLDRMSRHGLATPAEVEVARAEPLVLTPRREPSAAPHLVRRVMRDAAEIHTTLDATLQAETEAAVAEVLGALAGRNARDAAVIVVHNPTREVRAYVGSADWSGPAGQVDMARSPRSPGSALKPFLYALALSRGHELADTVDDLPGTWRTTHGAWSPLNYGEQSAGPVTLRAALANSLNVPAVRLLEEVGVADLHRALGSLGLSTLVERPDHYGLGLVLGDAEVRLDEMAAAYAALASAGRYRPLRFTGDAPDPAGVPVLDPVASFLVLDALDDPDARALAFGADSVLEAPYPLAAKTGTSTGFRDNWAVGTNPRFTVVAWVGNADGSEMTRVSGITGAGPLMRRVFDAAMGDKTVAGWQPPAALESRQVCSLSGGIATAACPGSRPEWARVSSPAPACAWHGEGTGLPSTYAAWVGDDAVLAAAGEPRVAYPGEGARFWLDDDRPLHDQAITLRAAGGNPAASARWLVDGAEIAAVPVPWRARWLPTNGDHDIVVEIDGVPSAPVRVYVGGQPAASALAAAPLAAASGRE
ncbi:MAG: transglycosylase domain-containing protein [Deltaproteobacteria bacterium]|nr:transglycosylase domain-containing protein [Deltaproteobacteria bacterium]